MRIITTALFIAVSILAAPTTFAQQIWRCGNYFTNNASEASRLGNCTSVNEGSVSIIPSPDFSQTPEDGSLPIVSEPSTEGENANANGNETQTAPDKTEPSKEEKRRDSQNLRKKKRELSELEKEYNNGEPNKIGPEFRNYQKYLDRVERLKKEIDLKSSEIKALEKD